MHTKEMEFEVEDLVMLHLWLERLLKRKHHKLHSHSVGPYKVLWKLGSNTYLGASLLHGDDSTKTSIR